MLAITAGDKNGWLTFTVTIYFILMKTEDNIAYKKLSTQSFGMISELSF